MPGSGNLLRNKRTWALFALLLCVFAGAILGDSAAESMLLMHCDTRLLPAMFMANALLLSFTSAFLISSIDRIDRGVFFMLLVVAHWGVVVAARGALALGAEFLYPFLFSYAYVSKIVLFLMFWTMANDLTDSRRAASVFPFIAAGGTIGAIGASFAIPLFLRLIATENLLIVWSAIIMLLGALFTLVRGTLGKELRPSPQRQEYVAKSIFDFRKDLKLIRQEPLLKNMAILYFLLFFILINQHYTFYTQLKNHLTSAKALASFLGFFNGCSMFATLILQSTIAGRVLTKFGSTRSMLFLPVILCIVFICLSCLGLFPGLMDFQGKSGVSVIIFWSVILGMGLRASFFDAFFSPNFQVFFSSLPKNLRGKGKLFIEGAVKPCAIITASLWLFFVVPHVSFGCSMFMLFCVSAVMIAQTVRIRKKYTESLTRSLTGIRSKQVVQLLSFVDLAKEENLLTALSRIIDKEDIEIKKYVIGILAEMNTKESIAVLTEHMETGDDFIRATIISSLTPLKMSDLKDTYARHMQSSDRRVIANCILALAALNSVDINEGLEIFLYHSDNRIRANTIMALWPLWSDRKRKRLRELLTEMLFSDIPLQCASALYAIGTLRATEFLEALATFAKRSSSLVDRSEMLWNNYLRAVANIGGEVALDMLLPLWQAGLGKRAKNLIEAISCILDNGYSLSSFLKKAAMDDYRQREIMLAALQKRHTIAKRENQPRLKQLALEEIKEIYRDWASLATLDAQPALPGISLLRIAVFEERIGDRLKNVIAVSSLLDESGHIALAARRLRHANNHVRAQALEVLDNTGDTKINRWVLKLLDANSPAPHVKEAASSFNIEPRPLLETIAGYASDPCEWIRECARYAAANLYYMLGDSCWRDVSQCTGNDDSPGKPE